MRLDSDRERFEALYRRHYAEVVRYAARRTDPAAAEDVAAEAFAIAWKRLHRVPDHALPWLLVAARNTLANRSRADTRSTRTERQAHVLAPAFARDVGEASAERDAVVRAFAALRPADREALCLVAWDGLSPADAARVAGATAIAFRMRLSRARRRLGALLDQHDSHPASQPIPGAR